MADVRLRPRILAGLVEWTVMANEGRVSKWGSHPVPCAGAHRFVSDAEIFRRTASPGTGAGPEGVG